MCLIGGPFAQSWTTTADQTMKLSRKPLSIKRIQQDAALSVIQINPQQTYQTIEGFGFTLTGGSATLINRLPAAKRKQLLQELFGRYKDGMAISSLRISMGASDLSSRVFTYDDIPANTTDFGLAKFSLSEDTIDLIPLLRQIISINPSVKITASPWTPPLWMKDNKSSIGGKLLPSCYGVYADYFVKYIRAMKEQGITIDAVTIQNEPQNPHNNPSLLMDAEEQKIFVKNHLGPAFRKSALETRIIIWDHNADMPEYPLHVLADSEAAQFVDGTAFHLYAGNIGALSKVHDAHPSKNIYFTEQWTGKNGTFDGDLQWHIRNVVIGSMRNWSKNALEWNLANDTAYGPHTPGGCSECKGALTISANRVERNVSYYVIAHASRFVPQGSIRIASQEVEGLSNVAFLTPSGKIAVIVLNEKDRVITCSLQFGKRAAIKSLPAKSVTTIMIKP
jgi:glucosylceramidase